VRSPLRKEGKREGRREREKGREKKEREKKRKRRERKSESEKEEEKEREGKKKNCANYGRGKIFVVLDHKKINECVRLWVVPSFSVKMCVNSQTSIL
jgi:hypothetical protein